MFQSTQSKGIPFWKGKKIYRQTDMTNQNWSNKNNENILKNTISIFS